MSRTSDFPAAAIGFFGGAILVALILFGVSRWTTSKFEGNAPAAAAHE
jgi:hypothetical protein